MMRPVVVLDPAHGRSPEAGGASPNRARGPHGILKSLASSFAAAGPIDVVGGRALQAPFLDRVVEALDRLQGTELRTFSNYRTQLVDGTVFGQRVSGLHRDFLGKLQRAEEEARRAIGSGGEWEIDSVGGFRASAGWHNWGLAVDLNYHSSPYIMHEAREGTLDAELGPVYHRIARLVAGRDSVVPVEITRGRPGAERTARLYDRLQEESTAMTAYFEALRNPATLERLFRSRQSFDWRAFFGDGTPPTSQSLRRRIMADYVILAGRSGPPVPGETYAAPRAVRRSGGGSADRPFAGDARRRDPERGFLSLRREVVLALATQGLRWGAIDFGGESGDVMHFDDGRSRLAANIARARREAAGGR